MVLPFFTGSGAALAVSWEARWSLKEAAFSFQMKSPSLASTHASTYQVPASSLKTSPTLGSTRTEAEQVEVVALTFTQVGLAVER